MGQPRIWCVGAGAVGGTLAARLARAGLQPIVVDADLDHVARLRAPGIVVAGDTDEAVPLDAYTPADAARLDAPCDLLLLAVRSDRTEAALTPFIGRVATGDVVSAQNGLNEERIAALVGEKRTIGCAVGFGATWVEPGCVELTVEGPLVIGRLDGSTDERLAAARDVLDQAFPTDITDDIHAALWAKLLTNAVTVLGAVGGVLTGEVLAPGPNRRIVCRIVAEGTDVAVAEGVALPNVLGVDTAVIVRREHGWREQLEAVLDAAAPAVAHVKSVTLRDFERGRPPEVEAVTGELLRRARRHGIDAPANQATYDMLAEIGAGSRTPSPDNLAELARRLGA
jgi:2-dehydropantoate 2-reductase